MDRMDEEILKLLKKAPDMPFLQIAKKIGVSPITVQKRFEEMKKEGIFFGSTTILDLLKIGFHGKAFLFITLCKDSNIKKVVKTFRQMPNLFLIVEIVGSFDLLIMVVFRNISGIIKVVNDIKEVPHVEKVEISVSNESFYPYRKEYVEINLFERENTELS